MSARSLIRSAHAIIFDFDGVLADSEEFQFSLWQELFQERGLPLDHLAMGVMAGAADSKALPLVLPGRTTAEYRELIDEKQRRYVDRLTDVPPVDGAVEFVTGVYREKRLFVCSNSPRDLIAAFLRYRFPAGAFESIVSAEDFTRIKPDPEPYLKALDRTGLAAHAVVAIEDSRPGVTSARAAGLPVIHLDRYGAGFDGVPTVAGYADIAPS
jgi:beta-phosphoglucomutase